MISGGKMKFLKVYRSFIILTVLIITLLSYCSKEDTIAVARVGARKITFTEFEKEFSRGKRAEMIQKSSLEDKIAVLNNMIDKQLKIIDAYQQNIDEDEKINEQVQERARAFMFYRLVDLEVTQKVVPESDIKEFFENSTKEVKIKQIVLKFDPNIPEQKEQALKRAKEVVQKIKAKEDFARLAESVSDDMNTAKKGGDKGYLKWGPRSVENPVYAAAFSMKENEVSDPIETQTGYYIIKVVHIKHYPGKSYKQERDRIRNQMFRMKNKELQAAYEKYLNGLKNKYKVEFNDNGIGIFIKRYMSPTKNFPNTPKDSLNVAKKESTPFDNFTEDEKKYSVSSFQNGSLTVADLIEELKRYPRHRLPQFKNNAEVQSFVDARLIPVYLLEKEAKKKNIQNDRKVKNQIRDFKEGLMFTNIQKIQITDKLEMTDDSLKSYFEKHREEYQFPEKREIHQIYVEDQQLADNIVRRGRRGENFAQLFRRYNQKQSLNTNNGISEITKGHAGIGRAAFELKSGEIADPIKIGRGFHVVKVLNIIDPVLKTFDEAKAQVNGKYRRIVYDRREKEWIEELRGRIDYVIYEKNLNKPLSQARQNYPELE